MRTSFAVHVRRCHSLQRVLPSYSAQSGSLQRFIPYNSPSAPLPANVAPPRSLKRTDHPVRFPILTHCSLVPRCLILLCLTSTISHLDAHAPDGLNTGRQASSASSCGIGTERPIHPAPFLPATPATGPATRRPLPLLRWQYLAFQPPSTRRPMQQPARD